MQAGKRMPLQWAERLQAKGCQRHLLAPLPMPQPDTACNSNMLILFDGSLQICRFVQFPSLAFTVKFILQAPWHSMVVPGFVNR